MKNLTRATLGIKDTGTGETANGLWSDGLFGRKAWRRWRQLPVSSQSPHAFPRSVRTCEVAFGSTAAIKRQCSARPLCLRQQSKLGSSLMPKMAKSGHSA